MAWWGGRVRHGLAGVLALACVGGAAADDGMRAAPVGDQPVAVRLVDNGLSGWTDLPSGVYRVPDSQVLVSGHQREDVHAAGLLEVVLFDAVEAHRGSNRVSDKEDALHIHLSDELRGDVGAAIGDPALSGRLFLAGAKPAAGSVLEVSPAVVLTFVDDTKAIPYLMLKVSLKDAAGNETWTNRYFAATGAERALAGDDGWLASDSAALRASLSASLAEAVKVMLADVAHPYPRDPARMMSVHTHVPFASARMYLAGPALFDDDRYLAVATKVGDRMVIAGVDIVDKSVATAVPTGADATSSVDASDTRRGRARAAKIARRDARRQAAAGAASAPEPAGDVEAPNAAPSPAAPVPAR